VPIRCGNRGSTPRAFRRLVPTRNRQRSPRSLGIRRNPTKIGLFPTFSSIKPQSPPFKMTVARGAAPDTENVATLANQVGTMRATPARRTEAGGHAIWVGATRRRATPVPTGQGVSADANAVLPNSRRRS
jgi:hypothetical protein